MHYLSLYIPYSHEFQHKANVVLYPLLAHKMETQTNAWAWPHANVESLIPLLQAMESVKQTPAYKNRLKALEFERTGGIASKKKGHKQVDK